MSPLDVLLAQTERRGSCRVWTGWVHPNGYGRCRSVNGGRTLVHREVYRLAKGEIPPGLEINHTCSVRACIEPDHLEAVTHQENLRHGLHTFAGINARKTHCSRGHALAGEDLYVNPTTGKRACLACRRL